MILYSTPCILLHARYKVGLLLEFFPLEKVHSTSTANRTWSPFCHFVAEDLIEISDFFANKILFIFVRLAFRNRENNTLQGYHEAPVDRTHSCFAAYCDKSIGMMKCYTPSVRPSVCLSVLSLRFNQNRNALHHPHGLILLTLLFLIICTCFLLYFEVVIQLFGYSPASVK